MKYVWIVKKNVSNGVDSWETIEEIFDSFEKAENFRKIKIATEVDRNSVEYYVSKWEVK